MPGTFLLFAIAGAAAVELAASHARAAQEPPFALVRIGSQEGLSHNSVYSLLIDRSGFLWAGTIDGLNRFDGYEFVVFRHRPGDPHSLPHPIVRTLFEDRHGAMWVGTDGGLARFDRADSTFHPYTLGGARSVWSVEEDHAGTFWVGTDAGLFERLADAESFVPKHLPAHPDAAEVLALDTDPSGALWALTATALGERPRLHRVGAEGAESFDVAAEWGPVSRFVVDRESRFWIRPTRPARFDSVRRRLEPEGPTGRASLTAAIETRDGSLWLGTDRGVCSVPPAGHEATCRPLQSGAMWLHNYVRALTEDRAGGIWLGTYIGLQRHDPGAKPFQIHAGAPFSTVAETPDGVLWLGSFGAGLTRLDPRSGDAETFRHRPGDRTSLRDDVVWAALPDARGTLWLATETGLGSVEPGRRKFAWHDLSEPRLTCLALDPGGDVWVGGASGLYRFDPRRGPAHRVHLSPQATRLGDAVESMLVRPDGRLWLGSGKAGLRLYDPRSGQVDDHPLVTPDGGPILSEGVWTIHGADDGTLWLGTGDGLVHYDPERRRSGQYLPADGLPGSVVYSVLPDSVGRLWLGTNRGLSRFDPGAPATRCCRNFDLSDGIGSLEFNRNAAVAGRDGRLHFGGIDGLTSFVPAAIRDDPYTPPVALTRVEVEAAGAPPRALEPHSLAELVLRPGDVAVTFTFAALAYANAGRNQYAYQLEGLDPDWVSVGQRRVARYVRVPPGRYQFRVRAANQDGVWNTVGLTLPVLVEPPYWRTSWFRAAALASALGLLYLAHRLHLRRLVALERLRLRIAGDLHDDLSSDLAGIAMVSELVRRRPSLDDEARAQLEAARDRALALVEGVRDTVWAVNPRHDSVESLAARWRAAAGALLGETPWRLEVAPSLRRTELPMAQRRALFLIGKELLHNIARHSRAAAVDVSLAEEAGRLVLRVRDDGVGFDPTAPSAGEGWRSLRRRVAELDGTVDLRATPGAGVEVTVRIPRTRDGWRARLRLQ